MPKTTVVFFRNADGSVPTKEWIDGVVAKRDCRAVAKLQARIELSSLTGEPYDGP